MAIDTAKEIASVTYNDVNIPLKSGGTVSLTYSSPNEAMTLICQNDDDTVLFVDKKFVGTAVTIDIPKDSIVFFVGGALGAYVQGGTLIDTYAKNTWFYQATSDMTCYGGGIS